jgi:hypothetical protein
MPEYAPSLPRKSQMGAVFVAPGEPLKGDPPSAAKDSACEHSLGARAFAGRSQDSVCRGLARGGGGGDRAQLPVGEVR